jgi:photosystem II stability/assembly factor-like uncharacterized protein
MTTKKRPAAAKKSAGRSSKKGASKNVAAKPGATASDGGAAKLTRPRVPRRPKFEVDDPARRFGELFQDRQFGSPHQENFPGLRLAALEYTRNIAPINETNMTPATPGGSNWIELGPTAVPKGQTYGGARVLVSGRVTEIVQHPTDPLTIYFAAARGGVWKSQDGGVTWKPKSDNAQSLAVGALAISRTNPQVLYAGTGEGDIYYYRLLYPLSSINAAYEGSGVLKTADGGATWTQQGAAQFTGACFYKMAVDPTNENVAFGATNLGLYRTTDGGATWAKLTGLPAVTSTVVACCDVVVHPTNHNVAYCAFWADGVYKTTNATVGTPTWTKVAGGFPSASLGRISLAVSPTSPSNVYALIANSGDSFLGLYASADDGSTWSLALGSGSGVQVYGAYTSNLFVDISTPDVVYISGVGVYKAVRSGASWSATNVGANIHPDNHAFAGHPTNHLVIYAGSDGGIFKSGDGGATWDDQINEGMNIMQFEFLGQHPTSDAVAVAGTQDNGTQMFRNHPAFYHSADGDGGQAGIDASDPRNVIHTYYGNSPERSTQGGGFGTYSGISVGIAGGGLFYPPFAYDDTNSQNIAFGTDRVNLDAAQGTGGWPTKVTLPGISGDVSAIHYVNSSLIYAATSSGQVYRLVKSGGWTATLISAAPLPSRWVWDVSAVPGSPNTVVVVMAGFGTPHVWRGTMSGATFAWANISGTAPDAVPDVPVNALVIDPMNATHYYVGTDIGVFRTTNAGAAWQLFSDGLPNTAVYDLRLLSGTTPRLLRAATHGRGLWERRLDTLTGSDVDLYVRDHLMSTARIVPTPSPVIASFDDPLQHVSVGDQLWWWQCADAKIDAPDAGHNFQMPAAKVDYVAYETQLAHRDPQRGVMNRVYVQLHNRGISAATNVTVKILYADASPGLPNLPANFWTAFPGNGDQTFWKAIGAAKVIPALSPHRPEILEWDWVPPVSAASHSCLLIVVDSASDPIPAAHKVFSIGALVPQEKRVGLKNLHVIDAPPGPFWSSVVVFGQGDGRDVLRLRGAAGWSVGLLFPEKLADRLKSEGLRQTAMTQAHAKALETFLRRKVTASEAKQFYAIAEPGRGAVIAGVPSLKEGFPLLLSYQATEKAQDDKLHLIQTVGEAVVGGNTFVLRVGKR